MVRLKPSLCYPASRQAFQAFLLLILVCTMLIASALWQFRDTRAGVIVIFHNKTDVALDGITIKFNNESWSAPVPAVAPGQKVKVRIAMTRKHGEASVYMHYRDAKGEEQSECILGYLEAGYKIHVKVAVTRVHEDGFIEFVATESSLLRSFLRL